MDAKPEDGTHHCTAFVEHAAPQHLRTFQTCKTHPGHEGFMTVEELKSKTPSDLGLHDGDTEVMADVWNSVHRTVRVIIAYTSAHRPTTYPFSKRPYPFKDLRGGGGKFLRYGTGFLCERLDVDGEELGIGSEEVEFGRGDEPCPCPECKTKSAEEGEQGELESKRQQSYYFVVITATHCVFDKDEAKHTKFELFYDSEDRTDVRCLYGVTVLGEELDRVEQDRSFVVCVTHDSQLADKLSKLCLPTSGFPIGILVSHPHGLRKRISLGKFIRHKCVLISENNSFTFRKGTTVRFSNCRDVSYVLKCINRRLGHREPTIGYVEEEEKEGDEDGNEKSEKRKSKTRTTSSSYKSKQTLKLLCDLTVSHDDLGISVMSDIEEDYSIAVENPQCQWWTLPSGIRLTTTDKGNKHYTLPEDGGGRGKETNEKSLTMEVFLPGVFFSETTQSDITDISSSMTCSSSISSSSNDSSSSSSEKSNMCGNNNNSNNYSNSYGKGDNNNDNTNNNKLHSNLNTNNKKLHSNLNTNNNKLHSNLNTNNNNNSSTSRKQHDISVSPFSGVKSFFFSTYDMASCPGSSGAMVHSRYHQQLTSGSRGVVHFGLLADNVTSTSGLNTLDRLVFN